MDNKKKNRSPLKNPLLIFLVISVIATVILNMVMLSLQTPKKQEISYSEFLTMLDENKVDEVILQSEQIVIYEKYDESQPITTPKTTEFMKMMGIDTDAVIEQAKENSRNVYYTGYIPDDRLLADLDSHGVKYSTPIQHNSPVLDFFLTWILPLVVIYLLFFILTRSMSKKIGGGGGIMGIGQSNAKMYNVENATGVTFADVAGQEEAKESLDEIVDYLHNPSKYLAIGAKQPKGALLVGPPGTGKTLLAKAVAGEAKVPFFSLSGSEFVEMFVGVGASRVRDLFEEAKKNAPCIVFIDEIDAIGKSRDSHYGGGNDEREQTLNQLLAEMDGFDTSKGLLILAATNRPEVLDPALLRPGRFDRRVIVDRPDLKGRVEILKVHAKDVLLDETVDLDAIALATSGAVGSDLANMINEAAILAVKNGRKAVSQKDLLESVEVVLVGKEKKDRILSPQERKIVSYHEVGHALVSALQKDAEPVQKITIVPRTMGALGYVMHVPEEEKFLNTQKELEAMLVGYLGGRAAEEIVFDTVTTGAANDIEQATKVARAMITQYGMSQKFGLMGLASQENQYLSGRAVLNCGDDTATEIDHEVMKLLHDSYEESKRLLRGHRTALDKIAEYLIRKETITGKEFMKIFRAVERGMEIPENLDELVFPEDVKELEDKAENQEAEISQSHSAETTVSADELSGEKETVSSEAEPANKNQESVRMETEPAEEGAQGEQKKEDSPVPEDDQKQQESENVSD